MPLVSKLLQIADAWADELDAGAYETAEDVLSPMQELTPVATGDLKGSERIEPGKGAGGGLYAVVAGGTVGPKRGRLIRYAASVEDDQPYAEPAAQAIDPALRPKRRLIALVKRSRV